MLNQRFRQREIVPCSQPKGPLLILHFSHLQFSIQSIFPLKERLPLKLSTRQIPLRVSRADETIPLWINQRNILSEELQTKREFPCERRQRFWLASARAKGQISLSPHPPRFFGTTMEDQLAKRKLPRDLWPAHKYLQLILILSIIPLGMATMEFQYTGILSKTDLSSTRWLPLDKVLLTQEEILASTLRISHPQSFFLYISCFIQNPKYLIPSSRPFL